MRPIFGTFWVGTTSNGYDHSTLSVSNPRSPISASASTEIEPQSPRAVILCFGGTDNEVCNCARRYGSILPFVG